MPKLNKKIRFFLVLLGILLFTASCLYARAGGAGGSSSNSSSSGDSSGIIYLIYLIFTRIPFPFNFIVAGICIVAYIIYKKKANFNNNSSIKNISNPSQAQSKSGLNAFLKNVPDFKEEDFFLKVKKAFMDIQQAWSTKTIGEARRYISDGVYQRFLTQTENMRALDQDNTIKDLKIHNIWIDKIEQDGQYDIIHAGISASATDRFISKKYPALNSGGSENFTEYWSFIRKRDASGGDLYNSPKCPNCAAPIEKEITDICQCPYCNTLLNSGKFDWILSEITQADDYTSSKNQVRRLSNLNQKVSGLFKKDPDFSVQMMEDKVSNVYLQLLMAETNHKPLNIRKFVNDNVFSYVDSRSKTVDYLYNRLFLNDVTLIGAIEENGKNKLFFSVKTSWQRVRIDNGKIKLMDPFVISNKGILAMERNLQQEATKGSLYGNSCPGCGAPIMDSTDIKCPYCGQAWTTGAKDWTVSQLMTPTAYDALLKAKEIKLDAGMSVKKMENMTDIKDYALTNLMIMIAADGVFDEKERQYANEMASHFGFRPESIQPMYQLAKAGKLTVIMPQDPAKKLKVYNILEKAALVDGKMSPEEQVLLDQIRLNYL